MKTSHSIIKPFFLISLYFFSCRKFVEIPPPPNELVSQNVFTSDVSATSAMVGTYSNMIMSTGFASGGVASITQLSGMSADELQNYATDPSLDAFYKNALNPTNAYVDNNLWNEGYKYIYSCNAILDGLNSSTGMTDSVKNELTGEAKFMRAFCHFYLVNLFGNIPIVLTTNYQVNAVASRSPVNAVYTQIIADLKDAQLLLQDDYHYSKGERIRPNKWAATALLARVYLYMNDWTDAAITASSVINNTGLYNLIPDLNSVFLANSSEAIWQLMPVTSGYNTYEGQTFILTGVPTNVALTSYVLNAFESGDNRRTSWVDSLTTIGQTYYFAYKYKVKASSVIIEYSMVLRLAEQFLIRSEAEAELNDLTDAASDLNAIRNRAGLPNTTAITLSDFLTAILHERQTELFTEWGHRWLDLKRNNLSDIVLGPIKTPDWQSTDTMYPIPKVDITNDPNLTQNDGY